jgi:Domain of unknown function (DUF4268)
LVELGALKTLTLKQVWKHEEKEFTPWLVLEEGLAALSEAVGIELEVVKTEVPVGPFFADILAKDENGAYVVIENQFGKTDHDHLGKLFTYGATLGATTVIWIAERFTDEHRKAIDWLNERTTDDLLIYAVQPEVIQIDGSRPAIRFNVVCEPNEVVREANAVKHTGELSAAKQLQFKFWTQFRDRWLAKGGVSSAQAAKPRYWYNIPLGRTGIHLSNTVNTWENKIGIRVYLKAIVADRALAQLEAERSAIEQEIGAQLVWNPSPENQDRIIALFREVDLNDRDRWPGYLDWMVDMTGRMREAFVPRVAKLTL